MTTHLYSMGGVDTIAANSLPQALVIWCELTTELAEDYRDDLAQIPDSDTIKIRYEFEMIYELRHRLPLNATFEFDVYYDSPVIQVIATAKEWAEVSQPTIICSTEW
ncbi:hypothetical protein KAR91_72095 [Candidatus Pacearchaeota archaeon]|nr:hypothetical protein [Candidatus Pacearchaeota archaeon]